MSLKQDRGKKRILEQFKKNPIAELACQKAGVPRSTYYRWRKADPAFANTCDEAMELSNGFINDLAETQLIAAIKERNMTAIIFWLKHHHSAYTTRIELNARIKQESQILTEEQAQQVANALRLAGLLQEPGDGQRQSR